MIDVLIVDDEPVVIELLRKEIAWAKYNMRVVGYAHDGVAAINFLKKRNVDIVFTDVKMPHMGGLEFIERVHEFLPDLLFVVISSYSDFELVRQSFKTGVFDYILKIDIDNDKVILPLLEKLRGSVQRENLDSPQKEEAEQLLRKANLNLNEKSSYIYKLITISLKDTAKAVLISELLFILRENAGNFAFGFFDWKINILCFCEDKESVLKTCDYLINKIYTSLESDKCKDELTIGCSDTAVYGRIETLHSQAEKALDYGFYLQGAPPFTYFQTTAEKYLDKKNFLFSIISKGFTEIQTDDMVKAMSVCFEEAFEARIPSAVLISDMTSFFDEMISKLAKQYDNEVVDKAGLLSKNIITNSYYELKDSCQKQLAELLLTINSHSNMSLTISVKSYIEAHYHEEALCVLNVAEALNVGKRTISNCFAEKMNSSFKNYLNDVRIEKAKELLTHSSLRINEISSQIGYANAEHFSRIFSERVGVSPMTYLKNNRI